MLKVSYEFFYNAIVLNIIIIDRVLDQKYPNHFHTDMDLKILQESEFNKYKILFEFIKNYSYLQSGGDLLPELIQFYQWLHHDLSNLITEDEAKEKSLKVVIDEYSDQYQFIGVLYDSVKGNQTKHSLAVPGKNQT